MSKKKIEVYIGEVPKEVPEGITIQKCRKFGEAPDEVEGHTYLWPQVICPVCGGVNLIILNDEEILIYECAYGYHTFSA